ncbi:MAG: gamma-glutamyltransferase [Planctomycetaceae bacterium]|nr:gamma-glutamyltransferase [Planctomycetaceae bacterium]
MPDRSLLTRRQWLKNATAMAAISSVPSALFSQDQQWFSRAEDHHATGKHSAVASTSRQASEASMWALSQDGNAADAYMTAALTQTVVEHGLTSIGGGFSLKYFDAATGQIHSVVGPLGPAAAESYDFDRQSPITQTGRAMPVPGFLAGVYAAHKRFGTLNWDQLFGPAIKYANEGFAAGSLLASAAKSKATRHPEGQSLWMKHGHLLKAGETLVQKELGQTLQRVADDGPEYFYTGDFARNYVRRASADGGVLTMKDMAAWQDLSRTKQDDLEGSYRGYQISSGGLNTYALHLNEALDLRATGPARTNPESLFRQYRIMEEVFLSSRDYSKETHEQYTSPDYARRRADAVLNGPLRKLTFDAIFNTCFLVVCDRDGNVAWGTHSINTPTAFGAGIVVDGVYAAHAMNREHVRGTGGSAPGVSTSLALFKDGQPRLIAGSPGFGFVHGPWQYCSGVVEWGLSPIETMNQPRFGLPDPDGKSYFEGHYDDKVFEMLRERKIVFDKGRPSPFTGLVGALSIDDDQTLRAIQDGRVDGYALAN